MAWAPFKTQDGTKIRINAATVTAIQHEDSDTVELWLVGGDKVKVAGTLDKVAQDLEVAVMSGPAFPVKVRD